MLFCSNCGHEISPGYLYCEKCRARIADQIPGNRRKDKTDSEPTEKPKASRKKIQKPDTEDGTELEQKSSAKKKEQDLATKRPAAKAHNGVGKIYTDSQTRLEGVVVKETSLYLYIISLKEYRESWCSYDRLEKERNSEEHPSLGFSGDGVPDSQDLEDYPAFKHTGSGWCVPEINDLKVFTIDENFTDADRTAVNRTLLEKGGDPLPEIGSSVYYWSSTESPSDSLSAEYVSMLSKSVGERSKYSKMSVRLFAKVRK